MAQQSGAKNSVRGKPITDVLRRLIGASPERINKMWEAQIKKAEEGDLYAFNAIMDRLEGKPVQATEISGPDGNDIQLSIPVHFIKPKDES